ncbi:MAG: CinA family protein [Candidatus Omnitrophota bacterium]
MRLEEKIAKKLLSKGKTLSLAESCTGGFLANQLTNIPGSSRFFVLSCVTYSNKSKEMLLGVPKKLIQRHGAVSQAVAEKMAKNVRRILKTDFGLAITGIAGPSGGTKTKPIGLTYIALATKDKVECHRYIFEGGRLCVKSKAAKSALRLLLRFL